MQGAAGGKGGHSVGGRKGAAGGEAKPGAAGPRARRKAEPVDAVAGAAVHFRRMVEPATGPEKVLSGHHACIQPMRKASPRADATRPPPRALLGRVGQVYAAHGGGPHGRQRLVGALRQEQRYLEDDARGDLWGQGGLRGVGKCGRVSGARRMACTATVTRRLDCKMWRLNKSVATSEFWPKLTPQNERQTLPPLLATWCTLLSRILPSTAL